MYQTNTAFHATHETNFLYLTRNGIVVDRKTMDMLVSNFLCSYGDFYTIYGTQM